MSDSSGYQEPTILFLVSYLYVHVLKILQVLKEQVC